MCGIVAYLGKDQCINYIINGLKQLLNRGYDSVGISYIENETLNTVKYASTNAHNSLERVELEIADRHIASKCGIGHTRWATHGGKTDQNAHPHHDNLNRLAIVHNGIIENFKDLKHELMEKGYNFISQTDTEVIAVLIGSYLDKGEPIESAIKFSIEQLVGTWALIVIHKDYPSKMWVTRNGSPLLLGFEDDCVMIASEQSAFNETIKSYIVLENHDLIEIINDEGVIKYNTNIHRYIIKEKSNSDPNTILKLEHQHWMLSEIMEQPDAIIRALNNGGRIDSNVSVKLGGLDSRKSDLLNINHLIILGCGTSYNAGLWSSDIYKSLDIFDTVVCYDGAEFNVKDVPKRGKTAVILLSQSGETRDLHRCIQLAKDYDLLTIGVVNVVDSQIARETTCGVYLNAGREYAVASTKSFTNQCIVLSMIAVWFSQNRGTKLEKRRKIISDLRNISFQMKTLLDNDCLTANISRILTENPTGSIFLLGKGQEEAIFQRAP
jgi:glucosamine--fructose-6-phosphate aminotransferase (isomerizing)